MLGQLLHEAGTLKDCLTLFWQSLANTLLWILHVQFMQHIVSQGKGSFLSNLAKMKGNSYGVSLLPIIFFEVNWYCQEQKWFIVIKSPYVNKTF